MQKLDVVAFAQLNRRNLADQLTVPAPLACDSSRGHCGRNILAASLAALEESLAALKNMQRRDAGRR
jgi:hypothetical protein